MKLKQSVVILPYETNYMMIDTDSRNGCESTMMQTNETGARIAQLLLDGTCDSESSLTDTLSAEYDAQPELIGASVRRMVDCLRENGFLTE